MKVFPDHEKREPPPYIFKAAFENLDDSIHYSGRMRTRRSSTPVFTNANSLRTRLLQEGEGWLLIPQQQKQKQQQQQQPKISPLRPTSTRAAKYILLPRTTKRINRKFPLRTAYVDDKTLRPLSNHFASLYHRYQQYRLFASTYQMGFFRCAGMFIISISFHFQARSATANKSPYPAHRATTQIKMRKKTSRLVSRRGKVILKLITVLKLRKQGNQTER